MSRSPVANDFSSLEFLKDEYFEGERFRLGDNPEAFLTILGFAQRPKAVDIKTAIRAFNRSYHIDNILASDKNLASNVFKDMIRVAVANGLIIRSDLPGYFIKNIGLQIKKDTQVKEQTLEKIKITPEQSASFARNIDTLLQLAVFNLTEDAKADIQKKTNQDLDPKVDKEIETVLKLLSQNPLWDQIKSVIDDLNKPIEVLSKRADTVFKFVQSVKGLYEQDAKEPLSDEELQHRIGNYVAYGQERPGYKDGTSWFEGKVNDINVAVQRLEGLPSNDNFKFYEEDRLFIVNLKSFFEVIAYGETNIDIPNQVSYTNSEMIRMLNAVRQAFLEQQNEVLLPLPPRPMAPKPGAAATAPAPEQRPQEPEIVKPDFAPSIPYHELQTRVDSYLKYVAQKYPVPDLFQNWLRSRIGFFERAAAEMEDKNLDEPFIQAESNVNLKSFFEQVVYNTENLGGELPIYSNRQILGLYRVMEKVLEANLRRIVIEQSEAAEEPEKNHEISFDEQFFAGLIKDKLGAQPYNQNLDWIKSQKENIGHVVVALTIDQDRSAVFNSDKLINDLTDRGHQMPEFFLQAVSKGHEQDILTAGDVLDIARKASLSLINIEKQLVKENTPPVQNLSDRPAAAARRKLPEPPVKAMNPVKATNPDAAPKPARKLPKVPSAAAHANTVRPLSNLANLQEHSNA